MATYTLYIKRRNWRKWRNGQFSPGKLFQNHWNTISVTAGIYMYISCRLQVKQLKDLQFCHRLTLWILRYVLLFSEHLVYSLNYMYLLNLFKIIIVETALTRNCLQSGIHWASGNKVRLFQTPHLQFLDFYQPFLQWFFFILF